VLVWKAIDADGDPETVEDQELVGDWEFNLEADATIVDSMPVTGGEDDPAWFELELGSTAYATVSEDLQDGYDLIDAFCVDFGPFEVDLAVSRLDLGDLAGELEGESVTFSIDPDQVIGCLFVNHLVPEDSIGGETETPDITLPPTDTFGGPAAPTNDSWRIMLVVMAGILASVLILTPSPVTRRK
jgi:hypothetical protein